MIYYCILSVVQSLDIEDQELQSSYKRLCGPDSRPLEVVDELSAQGKILCSPCVCCEKAPAEPWSACNTISAFASTSWRCRDIQYPRVFTGLGTFPSMSSLNPLTATVVVQELVDCPPVTAVRYELSYPVSVSVTSVTDSWKTLWAVVPFLLTVVAHCLFCWAWLSGVQPFPTTRRLLTAVWWPTSFPSCLVGTSVLERGPAPHRINSQLLFWTTP